MADENLGARLRLFFALWPPYPVQLVLHSLARQLKADCGGRIVRRESLHMTLMFLGMVDRARLPALCLAATAVHVPVFDFTLQRLLSLKYHGIGYAAPAAHVPKLQSLVEALRQSVAGAGFEFDHKPFVPHVTLLRRMERLPLPQDFPPLLWAVRHFTLAASETTPVGSRYCVVQQWPLDA